MNLPQLYLPHDNQKKIHQNKARYRVVVAGRRFGKSALALNEALARGFQLRDQIIWIILPLFRQAKEVYWIDPDITKYFMPYVQAGLIKVDKNELSLNIKHTNSWIRLKGSDNYDSLRGSGLDLTIWDEVGDTKEEAFQAIAPALADSPRHRSLYIGTPKGLNHFHDFALYGNHSGVIPTFEKPIGLRSDWETWHFSSLDNMTWPDGSFEREQFVSYIANQRREAEEKGKISFFNQEYMASFEESAGRFFPKWTYKSHVLDHIFYPKDNYIRIASMDWGRTAPFAWYAHAIVPTEFEGQKFNRIITFKEVYDVNKSPFEAAQLIAGKIDYKTMRTTYVDPSMGAAMVDGAASIVRQLSRAFEEIQKITPVFDKAANKRTARWAIMDNWMRTAPDGLPYWMITKDCINLIRTIPLMIPDAHDMEDLDTTLEDHACFCRHTPILTRRGYVPIIGVTTQDKVWTPLGWSNVLWSGSTGRGKIISYRKIKATENHPFLTQDGFRLLKDLKKTDKLWSVYTFLESPTEDILIRQDFQIKHILGVVQRRMQCIKASRFIPQFGYFSTGVYPKVIMFIIKILIMIETILKILKWSILPIIQRSIWYLLAKLLRNVALWGSKKQGNGIKAPRGLNGIPIMVRRHGKIGKLLSRCVDFVQRNSTPTVITVDSVAKITKCLCIGEQNKVYNLKTDTGMFTAKDVVVSNCDSVSYALQYIPWKDISHKPVKPGTGKKLPANPYNVSFLSKFKK